MHRVYPVRPAPSRGGEGIEPRLPTNPNGDARVTVPMRRAEWRKVAA
jgi:hypothetical protein